MPLGWENDVFSRNKDGTFTALDYAVIRLNPDVVVPSKYRGTTDVVVSTVGDASLLNLGCNHGATTGKNCGIIFTGIYLIYLHTELGGDVGRRFGLSDRGGEKVVGLNIGMDFGTQADDVLREGHADAGGYQRKMVATAPSSLGAVSTASLLTLRGDSWLTACVPACARSRDELLLTRGEWAAARDIPRLLHEHDQLPEFAVDLR
ncbi:hypothetical protein Rhow_003123 [Rhodococcus wratislaviensis]|uniref:Uncharacterized protein n=1 Tax=Rhodococcus wratislaviensis TaxID=44752 RepID=A0A402C7M4_RHOWR|nr:hypothetical protein Rhow_003123 [Rhodococcus wratislaviensis]